MFNAGTGLGGNSVGPQKNKTHTKKGQTAFLDKYLIFCYSPCPICLFALILVMGFYFCKFERCLELEMEEVGN